MWEVNIMLLILELWKHHVNIFRVSTKLTLYCCSPYKTTKSLNIISFHILGNGYTRSNVSFLFSLRNNENLAPFIANVPPGNEQYAIFCHQDYGPTFGGHDIYISNNANGSTQSYSKFGWYQFPPGATERNTLLAGSFHFTPTEIEVFF